MIIKFSSKVILIRRPEICAFLFIKHMIRPEIGLKIRHRGVMSLCAIEDKTAVVVVASYRSVSRNPVRFKALDSMAGPFSAGGIFRAEYIFFAF